MRIEWWLVRHGLTEWNVQRRYQGHSDLALLPGEASGLKPLRRELAGVEFSAVYASDLLRCRQTLEYARSDLAERCVADCRLREMDFGAWEGRTYELLKDDALYRAWIDDPQRVTPPDGESWQAFRTRVEDVCQELAAYLRALAAGGRSRREDTGEMRENAAKTRLDSRVMRENAETMPENAKVMCENVKVMCENVKVMCENVKVMPENAETMGETAEAMQENVEVSGEYTGVARDTAETLRKRIEAMGEHVDVGFEASKVFPQNSRTVRLLIVTHGGVISLLSAMLEPGLGFWDTRLPPGGIKRLYWKQ
ncbi:histidine phosphatase family protein [Paenibacillus macerans]|uniref:histidine phosphatase family protein n=1 Tax=Paenibacillus macerans TaxID=44252 RepID=UPI00203B79A9|nr:histidine phosphatase family protein [Paenibacillus macerans]MCM3699900.1 histidine phosphatase family protein [Paenibacillus macerans]